jgi:hypothetical protein
MKKLFCKLMILMAIALTHNSIFKWLKGFDDSLLPFLIDEDRFNELNVEILWWCKVRRYAA